MIWFVRWLDSQIGPKEPEARERYDEAWGRAGIVVIAGAAVCALVAFLDDD